MPIPETVTDCGLLAALSATVSEAVRLPETVGVKVTLMAQLAPAATEVPQLFVCVNSLALAPESEMPVTSRAASPELLRVMTWAALPEPTG